MKPSLFFATSLIALAGTAQAAIIFDYQANPGTTAALYNPSVSDGVSITGQTVTNASGGALGQKTGTNYVNSVLSPNVNVGTGGTWTLTLSFTVTEDVTIDSIALNLFTFNGSNQIQNSNRKGAYMFNLKLGDTVLASCADSSLTYAGTGDVTPSGAQKASVETLGQRGGSSGVREESSLDKAVTLTAGETYSMELSLSRGAETNGYFVGLGAIELNTVPEPATASLGLAGLAVLLLRRRKR